jgi:multimeric flavodoxin WrbA
MKIVGISCSPRKGKSTKYALEVCLQAVKETIPDAETTLIELSHME